ncbi:hypothetical protein BH09MYX1_BH09MYX1_07590 [soil metagenome]
MRAIALLGLVLVACGGATPPPATVEVTPAASASAPANANATEKYPIRLSRDDRVGDRARLVLDVERTSTTTRSDRPTNGDTEHAAYHLEATRTATAVDARGSFAAVTLIVSKLTATASGQPTELVKNGQEIRVTRAEKSADATVTIDGAAASPELRKALDATIELELSRFRDDDMWGSTEPRAIGAEWPVDVARATTSFAPLLRATTVQGTTKVVRLETVEGIPCVVLEGWVEMKGRMAKSPGMKTRPSVITARMSSAYPIDTTIQPMTLDATMRIDFEASVDNQGTTVKIESVIDQHSRGRVIPLR